MKNQMAHNLLSFPFSLQSLKLLCIKKTIAFLYCSECFYEFVINGNTSKIVHLRQHLKFACFYLSAETKIKMISAHSEFLTFNKQRKCNLLTIDKLISFVPKAPSTNYGKR